MILLGFIWKRWGGNSRNEGFLFSLKQLLCVNGKAELSGTSVTINSDGRYKGSCLERDAR
jgi:hypothetical protein